MSFVEDTAVAPEKLRDYIDEFLKMIHQNGTTAGVYAHASVGCLHPGAAESCQGMEDLLHIIVLFEFVDQS